MSALNWDIQRTYPVATEHTVAPSEIPQFRPLSWRTTLCRHFTKNQGWCPLVVPHTPCLAWPNCPRGHLCNYKHPEPLAPRAIPMPAPPPFQVQPPTPNVNTVTSGAVQYHGTTYFPVGVPQASTQSSAVSSSPPYSWNYSPLVSSLNSGHSPYSNSSQPFQSPSYETVSALPLPYSSQVPRAFANAQIDDVHSLIGVPVANLPVITESADSDRVAEAGEQQAQGQGHAQAEAQSQPVEGQGQETFEDFPYRPPDGSQRVGHAKRLSVTLKSKEDSDIARGPLIPATSQRRESWQGHRARVDPAHRSWPRAPDFLYQPRPPNQPSFQMLP
ncbi:hypothetical protein EIP86_000697 [Pleurotus ostreatoroseus]|nr:hypothetical protein EIP86_000697 [Pleurotus ostreatoroseus]